MDKRLVDAFEYYLAHQDEIVEKHDGRVVAIKNRTVLGDYEDEITAIVETQKKHKLGTFIVQRVSPGEGDYTVSFATAGMFR